MTTDSAIAARQATTTPVLPVASPHPSGTGARRGWAGRIGAVAAWGLVAGLVGFNVWWYRRDTRPLADARTIDRWIADGQAARAEAELRERLRRSPHDVEARMGLCRALAAGGDLLACARELQGVPYWSPRRAEALYRAAQAFLEGDRARDAEAALLALLDDDPMHPPDPGVYHDASQELLKIYALEDRWEDAYPIIWKAFDHAAPEDRPRMLTMRIKCELERISPVERIKVLRKYVAADPEDTEALRALANAEAAIDQKADALRHIDGCLRARPDDARAWRDYLAMLQSMGERDTFRDAMARLPKSAEGEPEIWMFRGQGKERDGDFEGAAADYRRALEIKPNLMNAHYRLATIETRLGHPEKAAPHRRRWQEMREAGTKLRQADAEYRNAINAAAAPEPKPTAIDDLKAATRQLGAICQALGLARAADACRQIIASL